MAMMIITVMSVNALILIIAAIRHYNSPTQREKRRQEQIIKRTQRINRIR